MRSPTTTGEECPGATAIFQTTLVAGPISVGSAASPLVRPEQLGPRNCVQSAEYAVGARIINKSDVTRRMVCGMRISLLPATGRRKSAVPEVAPVHAALSNAARRFGTPIFVQK